MRIGAGVDQRPGCEGSRWRWARLRPTCLRCTLGQEIWSRCLGLKGPQCWAVWTEPTLSPTPLAPIPGALRAHSVPWLASRLEDLFFDSAVRFGWPPSIHTDLPGSFLDYGASVSLHTSADLFRAWQPLLFRSVLNTYLQSRLTLFNPMDCSPPGSSVCGILQARILGWVAMPSSREIFLIQGLNPCLLVPCIDRQVLYLPGSPEDMLLAANWVCGCCFGPHHCLEAPFGVSRYPHGNWILPSQVEDPAETDEAALPYMCRCGGHPFSGAAPASEEFQTKGPFEQETHNLYI